MSQTLEEFIAAPFGNKKVDTREYEKSYENLIKKKKIKMVGYTEKDGMYFIHIKVGSESSSQMYDVVFLFYTNDSKLKSSRWFGEYHVKFFSNSPSFLYQYIVLYHNNDALIEELYDKMDSEYRDKLPTKANPDLKLSYEKSIYCAGRYMLSNKFNFNKFKLGLFVKKKSVDTFFDESPDFADMQMERSIEDMEKRLKKDKTSKSTASKKDGKKSSPAARGVMMGKMIKAKKQGLPVNSPKAKIKPKSKIGKKRARK